MNDAYVFCCPVSLLIQKDVCYLCYGLLCCHFLQCLERVWRERYSFFVNKSLSTQFLSKLSPLTLGNEWENKPPTPPLSQHFAQREKYVLMLA